jgi:hypothetical protein
MIHVHKKFASLLKQFVTYRHKMENLMQILRGGMLCYTEQEMISITVPYVSKTYYHTKYDGFILFHASVPATPTVCAAADGRKFKSTKTGYDGTISLFFYNKTRLERCNLYWKTPSFHTRSFCHFRSECS